MIKETDKRITEEQKHQMILEAQRKYREKNREKIRAYQTKWRRENPEKVKQHQRTYWEKKAREYLNSLSSSNSLNDSSSQE